ncbi:thiamine-phosphate kinase [Nakamurella sp. YIM 132084]|uniref:Thiamine-monophosphate kinase n=1 Tax=Nakamurella leprariae TaxID=2803911 RepID=A0A938YHU9_9ACTN|nr:thiamine-phosphate kinase [Nakamurella leprariae]
MSDAGEFSVIDAIVAGAAQPATTVLGPGDDAAVLAVPSGRTVATVDVLVDGVHFRTDWATGEQIGRRAALASLADVAAMGARPTALLVGVCAPADTPIELVTGIGRGLQAEAQAAGAGLVGGDLTSSPVLTISVTALGEPVDAEPVLRSGARPGDVVAVCGRLGWAAAGLDVLSRGFRSPAAVVNAYRVPEPPLAAGPVAAVAGATAMIDVSDGLLADVGHIADASGVRIDLSATALTPAPRLLEVASALGRNASTWVLTGGDDHALVATFPAGAALPDGWQPIGTVLEDADGQTPDSAPDTVPDLASGVRVTVDGQSHTGAAGWDHFGRPG